MRRQPAPVVDVPPAEPYRCTACHATSAPLETVDLPGAILVRRCVDPVLCRRRAEAAGIYCTTAAPPLTNPRGGHAPQGTLPA